MTWSLDCTLPQFVAEEVGVPEKIAGKVVKLFETGNEVTYVARYRVDAHEGLSCEQVRRVYEAFVDGKRLNEKVEKAIKAVQTKAPTKEEASLAIEQLRQARDGTDVTEIAKIYSAGKKTKAGQARNLGLDETADAILNGDDVDLKLLVDNNNPELKNVDAVKEHLKYLLADKINKRPEVVELAKKISNLEMNVHMTVESKATKQASNNDGEHFKTYANFKIDPKRIQNHQVLAIMRGEEKDALSWTVTVDVKGVHYFHPMKDHLVSKKLSYLYHESFSHSMTGLLIPKIKRAVKRILSKRAELGAIDCFSKNLAQLFNQDGVRDSYVVALDPGYKACKVAFLEPNGTVVSTSQLAFHNNFNKNGEDLLKEWVQKASGKVVIAIGDGSGSIETQQAIQGMIAKHIFAKDVKFCVVPESGASKYSITPLAEEELPGMPVTEKSAVSIGRRLIDPVSEYVKIEPKHLGLGMYQHSVDEKKLSDALELIVTDCVSLRGVDVNLASQQLLQHVCGLTKKTAAGIIELRQKLGRITSRNQISDVKGLGPKAFQQCAGFLTVAPPSEDTEGPPTKKKRLEYNPLDATTVHPEKYELAERILTKAGMTVSDARTPAGRSKLHNLEFQRSDQDSRLVIDLLTAEYKLVPPPPLMTVVKRIESLKVGDKLMGRVRNHTDFGIFIDIGGDCTALAHASTLQRPFPQVGTELMVKIISNDASRRRIGVAPC